MGESFDCFFFFVVVLFNKSAVQPLVSQVAVHEAFYTSTFIMSLSHKLKKKEHMVVKGLQVVFSSSESCIIAVLLPRLLR